MNAYQKTIGRAVTLSGVGVHGGAPASARLLPADADTGILFQRSDIKDSAPVCAHVSQIGATDLCTSLGAREARIDTVEHLMAAISALGIDNLVVEIEGRKFPFWMARPPVLSKPLIVSALSRRMRSAVSSAF